MTSGSHRQGSEPPLRPPPHPHTPSTSSWQSQPLPHTFPVPCCSPAQGLSSNPHLHPVSNPPSALLCLGRAEASVLWLPDSSPSTLSHVVPSTHFYTLEIHLPSGHTIDFLPLLRGIFPFSNPVYAGLALNRNSA